MSSSLFKSTALNAFDCCKVELKGDSKIGTDFYMFLPFIRLSCHEYCLKGICKLLFLNFGICFVCLQSTYCFNIRSIVRMLIMSALGGD